MDGVTTVESWLAHFSAVCPPARLSSPGASLLMRRGIKHPSYKTALKPKGGNDGQHLSHPEDLNRPTCSAVGGFPEEMPQEIG